MKINISSPLKREEIKQLLLSQTKPKYEYVKNLNYMEMQFEATDFYGIDLAVHTKDLIKAQPWGRMITYRILLEGQQTSWDK